MMMSVCVEITSYLSRRSACEKRARGTKGVQLDNVGMSQSAHVLNLALHSGLGSMLRNGMLRDELHGDLLTGNGVYGHYAAPSKTRADRENGCMLTLDFPERALRDLIDNGVLSEPVRRKLVWWIVGHGGSRCQEP